VSIALGVGERFGLLGINGAGKVLSLDTYCTVSNKYIYYGNFIAMYQTTTLSILTGDIPPTSGTAFISGLPLSDPRTRESIGYCPQTDPLLDLMNAYETLFFFGRIRRNTMKLSDEELREKVAIIYVAL
jgi:ATP-binding cassette subfamily A (ABC1) protein 3